MEMPRSAPQLDCSQLGISCFHLVFVDTWTVPLDDDERHRLALEQIQTLHDSYSVDYHDFLINVNAVKLDMFIEIGPQIAIPALRLAELQFVSHAAASWQDAQLKFHANGENSECLL